MNACEARGRYEKRGGVLSVLGPIRKAGGGGGGRGGWGVESASGPIRKVGGGGGTACRTMIYILVCARARDSAWGMERGGGGGRPPPEPMLDPGLPHTNRSLSMLSRLSPNSQYSDNFFNSATN